MNIHAECTIDLDEKRRVWSEMTAELDEWPDPSQAASVCVNLSQAAADGALRAYNEAAKRHPILGAKQKNPLATFGDGNGED